MGVGTRERERGIGMGVGTRERGIGMGVGTREREELGWVWDKT